MTDPTVTIESSGSGGSTGQAKQVASTAKDKGGEVAQTAGVVGDYARQTGDRLRQIADRMESGGLAGLMGDLSGFARHHFDPLRDPKLVAGSRRRARDVRSWPTFSCP